MKVGLTGGIGCGKSTVVQLFEREGFRTIESDAVVRELLNSDPVVLAALEFRWGSDVLLKDGGADRKAVAERVFRDTAELKWLEELLHPLVRESWLGAVEAEPGAEWLVEIPLLFEKRLETLFDLTVCVASPDSLVETRMRARGYSSDEIERRRRQQMPLDQKISRADYVLSNAGSLEFLKQQTVCLVQTLRGG
ncbi:dephospho-CoA kinase [Coraliomargarita parva]|uniref:dephospho-CoA kinase n=1 Tax=Coraliomargarita parva TaxID=3014050 RepID=UPI0022B327CD|nr:dephospho-CoA kinase [Coraliomargarita parva]